jgi:RNA polymerase sigma-70 factor (ECF subfamily)
LLGEVIAGLPERCRRIFLLRVADGLSYPEIARELAVSESTVRTQMARALAKCADAMRERGVRDER